MAEKFPEGLCEDQETQRHFFDGLACALLRIGVPSTNVEWEMGWEYGDQLRTDWADLIKRNTPSERADFEWIQSQFDGLTGADLRSAITRSMEALRDAVHWTHLKEIRRDEETKTELETARHALGAFSKQYGEVLAQGCGGCKHEATLWKCTHLVPHPSQNPITVAQYTDSREARIKELEDKYDKVPHALQGCQENLTEAYKRIKELEKQLEEARGLAQHRESLATEGLAGGLHPWDPQEEGES